MHNCIVCCVQACRLLQSMIELPLEGFLLTPVQKICKYPLQLRELLRNTDLAHADYEPVSEACDSMQRMAAYINERKRKMDTLQQLSLWQAAVHGWQVTSLQSHG